MSDGESVKAPPRGEGWDSSVSGRSGGRLAAPAPRALRNARGPRPGRGAGRARLYAGRTGRGGCPEPGHRLRHRAPLAPLAGGGGGGDGGSARTARRHSGRRHRARHEHPRSGHQRRMGGADPRTRRPLPRCADHLQRDPRGRHRGGGLRRAHLPRGRRARGVRRGARRARGAGPSLSPPRAAGFGQRHEAREQSHIGDPDPGPSPRP